MSHITSIMWPFIGLESHSVLLQITLTNTVVLFNNRKTTACTLKKTSNYFNNCLLKCQPSGSDLRFTYRNPLRHNTNTGALLDVVITIVLRVLLESAWNTGFNATWLLWSRAKWMLHKRICEGSLEKVPQIHFSYICNLADVYEVFLASVSYEEQVCNEYSCNHMSIKIQTRRLCLAILEILGVWESSF